MGKKRTTEDVNLQLMPRGIYTNDEYLGNKIKIQFQCSVGHTWIARPDQVLRGCGCPTCSDTTLSKDIINSRILHRNIHMVSDYVNANTKSTFACDNGHTWMTSPNHVTSHGHGCPHCSGVAPLSNTKVNSILASRSIELISPYVNNYERSVFQCSSGHQWSTEVSSVIRGHGCPYCAEYGFNPSNPAWEYAFTRDGYIKYGITNNLTRRLFEHRRHGEINLIHERYQEIGQLALDWERHIKRTHGGRFATKEQCPDGHTETLPSHMTSIFECNEVI